MSKLVIKHNAQLNIVAIIRHFDQNHESYPTDGSEFLVPHLMMKIVSCLHVLRVFLLWRANIKGVCLRRHELGHIRPAFTNVLSDRHTPSLEIS